MKTTQVSIKRWMDKQNVAYLYNRIWFSYKKEQSTNTCHKMMNLENDNDAK